MIVAYVKSCCLAACVVFCFQSLADVAREEAERRRLLDQQGIEGKVIDVGEVKEGNGAVSTGPESPVPRSGSGKPVDREERKSLRSFRTALQKLDRAIRECEDRLESRRVRLRSERWEIPKSGRGSRRASSQNSQGRLREEIEDLELKLKRLQQERSEVYAEGKKAGFLPGELSGKGIIP